MSFDPSEESGYHAARGTLYLLAKAIVVSLLGAILYISIARILPETSDLGLFQGAQSLIAVCVVLSGSGLARASIRFISFDIGSGNTMRAVKTFPTVFVIGVGISTLVSISLFLISDFVSSVFFHNESQAFLVKVLAIDAFLVTMIAYSNCLLYAIQQFRKSFIISTINMILKVVITMLLLLQVSNILYVFVAFIIADAISLILFIYSLFTKLSRRPLPTKDLAKLWQYSNPLYGSSILGFLAREMDIYMLLILSTLSAVGIYGPAVLIGTVLFWTLSALDHAIAPYFPRVFGRNGLDSLKVLSRIASRYLFLIYVPLCFLILGALPDLISLALGEKYLQSIYPSIIIVLSITFTSIIVIFNNILMSTGHSRIFITSSLIALAAQLIVSIFVIPSLAEIGAALARACSYIILFIYPAMMLKRISGLQYDTTAVKAGIAGSIVIMAIVWLLNDFMYNIFFLPAKLMLAVLGYLLFLRFTRVIVPKDLEIMKNVLGEKSSKIVHLISRIVI